MSEKPKYFGVTAYKSFGSEFFPIDRIRPSEGLIELLNRVLVVRYEDRFALTDKHIIEIDLYVDKEIIFELPGLSGFSLIFGGGSSTAIKLVLEILDNAALKLQITGGFRVRFSSEILHPVIQENGKWVDDPAREYAEVLINVDAIINSDWSIAFDGINEFQLEPSMIADTGIIIEGLVSLDLSENSSLPEASAMGLGPDWKGVVFKQLAIHLPDSFDISDTSIPPSSIILRDFFIGNGGLSGSIEGTWSPNVNGSQITGEGSGKLFGFPFGLRSLQANFVQNSLVGMSMRGIIGIPYFNDVIDVGLSLDLDGNVSLQIEDPSGLAEFSLQDKSNNTILNASVNSVMFEIINDQMYLGFSANITPMFGGLDWPTFQIQKMYVDVDGNLKIEGGWIDLPQDYSFNFHAFRIEISKIGFGKTDDGGKWMGFNGSLRLIDGLQAGASVEGLRIAWYDDERATRLTFDGIGVEFEIPSVLSFKGYVSYKELPDDNHRFDGDIKLRLTALDLEIDAQLVIGYDKQEEFFYMAIYLGVELPAGIPLGATGIGFYGMAGLFALQMEPGKRDDEPWYGMGEGEGWFKRPEIGVGDLEKWDGTEGSLGFGAGVTIGTIVDNGYIFSGRMLLVIVFPGPIIFLEGKANILKKRSSLDEEPIFRALAVLDFRQGSFLIGVDAQYNFGKSGGLIDIGGGAEAFFSFSDLYAWHLYLGMREPPEKRIRASVLRLFRSDSYFMLDAKQLAMGALVGYDANWKFGPIKFIFEAWIEGNASISWIPPQFHGDLGLHGKIGLSIFGIGFELSIDGILAADVFTPFHLLAGLKIGIRLWPLPKFSINFQLEWGPEKELPPLPVPLKEVTIGHFKSTTTWPLPPRFLTLPSYDDGENFLKIPAEEEFETVPEMDMIPVVPMDCRPQITFGRSVFDEAKIGINLNPQELEPKYEIIGDPEKEEGSVKVSYVLEEASLEKFDSSEDELLDNDQNKWSKLEELYGSWAPLPKIPIEGEIPSDSDAPVVNTKLHLFSLSAFGYTRFTGSMWDDWFRDHFKEYPCPPMPKDRILCCDFEKFPPSKYGTHSINNEQNSCGTGFHMAGTFSIKPLDPPIEGKSQALCFEGTYSNLYFGFSQPNSIKSVIIKFKVPAGIDSSSVFATIDDIDGNSHGPFYLSDNDNTIEAKIENDSSTNNNIGNKSSIDKLLIISNSTDVCIFEICINSGPDPKEVLQAEEIVKHLNSELSRWSGVGKVLEPNTVYRLKIVTKVEPQLLQSFNDSYENEILTQTSYSYFKTGGPPGLTKLSVPINQQGKTGSATDNNELNDLGLYVRQTVPATVPNREEKPPLPRPVYRSYDVGVEFNENYVDLLYKLANRDLRMYLRSINNQPVRDTVSGRLLVFGNPWGVAEKLSLHKSEETWIRMINKSKCAILDPKVIPKDRTLFSSDQILDPDTVYEARLKPLLLSEYWQNYELGDSVTGPSGSLNGWKVIDEGEIGGPSKWTVEEGTIISEDGTENKFRYIRQSSNIGGGSNVASDPVKPGTTLVWISKPDLFSDDDDDPHDQPLNWTNYRFSANINAGDNDTIGLLFWYKDGKNLYRYSQDRQSKFSRLVKIKNGNHTILAEDNFVYKQNQDYLITIEAIENSIRVYRNEKLVFDVLDSDDEGDGSLVRRGTVGFYCRFHKDARFKNVFVDDFGEEESLSSSPVLHKFEFVTSKYTNFFHHMHSYDDLTWIKKISQDILPAEDISGLIANSVSLPAGEITIQESHSYESLAQKIFGSSIYQPPKRIEVTKIEYENGIIMGLFVQSPEPIDWKRCDLHFFFSPYKHILSDQKNVPLDLKLTGTGLSNNGDDNDDLSTISLLVREKININEYRIESRGFPKVVDAGLLLLNESFVSLDGWTIVDEGNAQGPSNWEIVDGKLFQTTNIHSSNTEAESLDKPGTYAVVGNDSWTDYRLTVTLTSHDDDSIGVLVRYQNGNNYYLFSMDKQRNYRRLIKKLNGNVIELWKDNISYMQGKEYVVSVKVVGEQIIGYVDGNMVFDVSDNNDPILNGKGGLYCWANIGAEFSEIKIHEPIWQPYYEFNDKEILPPGSKITVSKKDLKGISSIIKKGSIKNSLTDLAIDENELRLTDQRSDLRIVEKNNIVGHTRSFLSKDSYAPHQIQVLRKADGTGFFIFSPASNAIGSELPRGCYRLGLTYRKDNQDFYPESQILSEQGNKDPEVATLDIPFD